MNKPVSRRLFGKLLASAPLATQSATIESVERQLRNVGGYIDGGMPIGRGGWGLSHLANPKIYTLFKAGFLPDWVRAEIAQQMSDQRRLSPDVACLRSVSLSAKCDIQRQRDLRSVFETADVYHAREAAKRAFFGDGEQAKGMPPQAYIPY